jgi:hypothetical protein
MEKNKKLLRYAVAPVICFAFTYMCIAIINKIGGMEFALAVGANSTVYSIMGLFALNVILFYFITPRNKLALTLCFAITVMLFFLFADTGRLFSGVTYTLSDVADRSETISAILGKILNHIYIGLPLGIAAIFIYDKIIIKKQLQQPEQEKIKEENIIKKVEKSYLNNHNILDSQKKHNQIHKTEKKWKIRFFNKKIFVVATAVSLFLCTLFYLHNYLMLKPFDFENIEKNRQEVYNFVKAKNKKLPSDYDYNTFYNGLGNHENNYEALYNSLKRHDYPVPDNIADFKKGLGYMPDLRDTATDRYTRNMQTLYNFIGSSGIKDMPDFETFRKKMSNLNNLNTAYKIMVDSGVYKDMPDFEGFAQKFGISFFTDSTGNNNYNF